MARTRKAGWQGGFERGALMWKGVLWGELRVEARECARPPFTGERTSASTLCEACFVRTGRMTLPIT